MSQTSRLVDPKLLPTTLWEKQGSILSLPPELARAYEALIDRYDMRALRTSRDPENPPLGGVDQKRTDQHFAQAFDGSTARAELAMLDPKGEVSPVTDAFFLCLSGNHVSLTDAPCGAGAAGLAFLTTIAELRARDVLPRLPLQVKLLSADISRPAMNYASTLLQEVRPFLEEQAVFVDQQLVYWNVLDRLTNTDLINKMTKASVECTKEPVARKGSLTNQHKGYILYIYK